MESAQLLCWHIVNMNQMGDMQKRKKKNKAYFSNPLDIFASQYYTGFPKAANF